MSYLIIIYLLIVYAIGFFMAKHVPEFNIYAEDPVQITLIWFFSPIVVPICLIILVMYKIGTYIENE